MGPPHATRAPPQPIMDPLHATRAPPQPITAAHHAMWRQRSTPHTDWRQHGQRSGCPFRIASSATSI